MAFSSKVFSKSQLFTTAGANSFVVPANVSKVWVTMVGGGTGGAGGHATGGGGGGGGPGQTVMQWPLPVTPGTTLTCTVGAKTTGAAIGAASNMAGASIVTGGLFSIPTARGGGGAGAGAAVNGGSGGPTGLDSSNSYGIVSYAVPAGGAAAGAVGSVTVAVSNIIGGTAGGAGAGTGGGGGGVSRSFLGTGNANHVAGGTNIGGGAGGCTPFGNGGVGGTTSVAGTAAAATAYGAGGGGGGQNAAGEAGCDGMILIEWTGS